jgi:hypothetical protein
MSMALHSSRRFLVIRRSRVSLLRPLFFSISRWFFPAQVRGDFFAREAVQRIDKPVNRGSRGGDIRALGASGVRLSWFRRRCNKSILTFPGLRKRGDEVILMF